MSQIEIVHCCAECGSALDPDQDHCPDHPDAEIHSVVAAPPLRPDLPLSPTLSAAVAADEGLAPGAVTSHDCEWLRALGLDAENQLRGWIRHQSVDPVECLILAARAGAPHYDALARLAGRLQTRTTSLRAAVARRDELEAEIGQIRTSEQTLGSRLADALRRLEGQGAAITAERAAHQQEYQQVQERARQLGLTMHQDRCAIEALRATCARLEPLAAVEQRRQDQISARRSRASRAAARRRTRALAASRKAQQEALYRDLLAEAQAALVEGHLTPVVHGALARRLGVTRAYGIVWTEQAGAPPVEHYEAAYHTTPSGRTRVYHPNAYGYRTTYHCAVREIRVGRTWVRRHLRSLCREAAAHRDR